MNLLQKSFFKLFKTLTRAMKNITYDKLSDKFNFFYEESSEKFPTIIGLREKDDSNSFWANTIDSYDFPIFFNIYNLDDITTDESGEHIKKAFAVISNKAFENFFCCKNEKLNRNNEIEIIFNPPRKITYLVNFTKSYQLYEKIKTFKCPKTGSYKHNRIINNQIIQRLILPSSPFIHIFYHKIPNTHQELKRSFSNYQNEMLNTERDIIRYLLKENNNNNFSEVLNEENNSNFIKTLIDNLKKLLFDNCNNKNEQKNIMLKVINNNKSLISNEQKKKKLFDIQHS